MVNHSMVERLRELLYSNAKIPEVDFAKSVFRILGIEIDPLHEPSTLRVSRTKQKMSEPFHLDDHMACINIIFKVKGQKYSLHWHEGKPQEGEPFKRLRDIYPEELKISNEDAFFRL